MEEIRLRYEALIAKKTGLPVDFLQRVWAGRYSPETHLFYRNKSGGIEAKWANELDMWKKITEAYLFWFTVPDTMQHLFWDVIYKLQLQTPDFDDADMGFKIWLLEKSNPNGLLGAFRDVF